MFQRHPLICRVSVVLHARQQHVQPNVTVCVLCIHVWIRSINLSVCVYASVMITIDGMITSIIGIIIIAIIIVRSVSVFVNVTNTWKYTDSHA